MSLLKEITDYQRALLAKRSLESVRTVGHLLRKIEHSTLPQKIVDDLKSLFKDSNKPVDHILTDYEIEQVAAIVDIDLEELRGLMGIRD